MREKKQIKNLRIYKTITICLVVVILIFVLLLFCRLQTVIIEGSTHFSTEELQKKIVTKPTDQNTLLLYLRYKYRDKVNIPFVEDIDITLVNLNTVKIHVYEKVITGCIEFMGGYMYFDKDGIVVESSDVKLEDIPIVTGLQFNKIVLYDKLKIEDKALFNVVLNLSQLIKKYDLNIEKIEFNSDLEVTLYQENIRVFLGKRETYDEQLAVLKSLLASAEGRKLSIDLSGYTEDQDKIIAKPLE